MTTQTFSGNGVLTRQTVTNELGLATIVIIEGYSSIGDSAFLNCSSLTSVTIGASVTSIGSSAFYGCSSLESVIIPNLVTSIGDSAFYDCSLLESVIIPNLVTSINMFTFTYCSSLTSVTIGASVTSIGTYAFQYCTSLTSIIVPNSVTIINNGAFAYCSSLTSVTIGTSVNSILSDVFYGCSSLASITIPISVTQIGNNAFYNCAILTVAIAMNNPLEIPSPHPVRDIPFYGTIVNTILPPIAPIITTQPSSAIVNPESSATFFVIATGNPTPNYQWFFNTNSIPGATSSSYTTNIAGNYYVVVTNSEGSVTSNTVTLYVNTTITTGTELIDFMNNSFAINGTIMDNIVINQPLINLTSINKNLTSDSQIIITYG